MLEVAVLFGQDNEFYVIPEDSDFDVDSFLQTLEELGVRVEEKEISFCG